MTVDRLTEIIRPLKARSSQHRQSSQHAVSHALRGIELREAVEAELRPYVEALENEIAGLAVVHRLYGGAWVTRLSVRRSRPRWHGRRQRAPASNRMTFAVEVDPISDQVTLSCRASVFDRDLESHAVTAGIDAAGRAALRDCIEEASLAFARRFVLESAER